MEGFDWAFAVIRLLHNYFALFPAGPWSPRNFLAGVSPFGSSTLTRAPSLSTLLRREWNRLLPILDKVDTPFRLDACEDLQASLGYQI